MAGIIIILSKISCIIILCMYRVSIKLMFLFAVRVTPRINDD
jgi:hypothetical protein